MFITPLTIRKAIREELAKLNFRLKDFKGQNPAFIQHILRIYQAIEHKSLIELKDKFHFDSENRTTLKFLFKLYYEIKSILKEQATCNDENEIEKLDKGQKKFQRMKVSSLMYNQISLDLEKKQELILNNIIDRQILTTQKISGQLKIRPMIPLKKVLAILAVFMQEKFMELNEIEFIELLSNSALYTLLQGLIIKTMSYKETVWCSAYGKHHMASTVLWFSPIPQQRDGNLFKKEYCFLQNNENFKLVASNTQNESFLLLPYFQNRRQIQTKRKPKNNTINWRSQNSKAIDFIIMKPKNQQEIEVFCYDVSGSVTQIKKKVQSFLDSYKTFKNRISEKFKIGNANYKLKVFYIVLIPQVLIAEKEQLYNELKKVEFKSTDFTFDRSTPTSWTIKQTNKSYEMLEKIGVQLFSCKDVKNEAFDIQKYLSCFQSIRNRV